MRTARTHTIAPLWSASSLLTCAAFLAAAYATAATQARPSKNHPRKRTATSRPVQQAAASPLENTATEKSEPVFTGGIRDNNVGVALMDAHRFSEAFARFQTACIMVPNSDRGCLNSGIALLAMRQFDQARKILATSAARDPKSARTWYNLGLLDRAAGHTKAALADFQRVAALDPEDAETQCLIGLSYIAERQYGAAFKAFQAALKIDPLNPTAESGSTEALAKTGKAGRQTTGDNAEQPPDPDLLKAFGEHYGEQGKYSLAAEIPPPDVVGPAIPVHFIDVTRQAGLLLPSRAVAARGRGARGPSRLSARPAAQRQIHSIADFLGGGACVFDYDGDGRPDIFLADDGNGDAALYRNLGRGRFVDVTKAAKVDFHGTGMGCAVGDYDNDGHPDLAISLDGGVRLYHNNGKGAFADVTAASGIQIDGLVMGLSFVDYNRDGNLDLYATRFHDFPLDNPGQAFTWPKKNDAPGNMMWRNNGDGSFSDVTGALDLAGSASSTGAVATELSGHSAVDFLLTGLSATPSMLMNGREGTFKNVSWWGAETQGPTAAAVPLDFDKDGYMDVALTHWQPTTLGLWRNMAGKGFQRAALPDPGWMRAWGIAALDYDNDGWIDLVAVGETFSGEGRIALLRNEGGKGFHDVTPETGLDKIALHDPRSIIAFDAGGDGSVDLLITQNHRPPVLLNAVGATKHNWAQIALRGATQNRMGIGVRVEMISGALRQTWDVPGASGYLSQGPPLISTGLGDEGVDAVRVRWDKNAVQVQLRAPVNQKTLISQADAGKAP